MINSDIKQETVLDDFRYDTEAIAARARDILKGNRQYQKLREQLERLNPYHDLAKLSMVQTQLRKMETDEMARLTRLEEEQRKSVNRIADMLKDIDTGEYNRYQELMAGISLLLDIMDSAFSDVNRLLDRNRIGINIGNFPELAAARKTAWAMASAEQDEMAAYKHEIWSGESDRLYKILQERCAVFRRKVERIEDKLRKIEEKGEEK